MDLWPLQDGLQASQPHQGTLSLPGWTKHPMLQKMPEEWRTIYSTISGEKNQKKKDKEREAVGIVAEIVERERVAMDFLGVARTAEKAAYQDSPLKPHSVQESLSSISTKRGWEGTFPCTCLDLKVHQQKRRKTIISRLLLPVHQTI